MSEQQILFELFVMAEYGCLNKFQENFQPDNSDFYVGVDSAFSWASSPEGFLYWFDFSEYLDLINFYSR